MNQFGLIWASALLLGGLFGATFTWRFMDQVADCSLARGSWTSAFWNVLGMCLSMLMFLSFCSVLVGLGGFVLLCFQAAGVLT